MEIICAAGERLTLKPFLAFVRRPIAVSIGEFPDARRRGDVERALEPETALGEHQLVGEDHLLVEDAVAIRVLQAQHAMRFVGELLFNLVVGAGGIRDVKPALLVEIRLDGPRRERGRGCHLDGKAIRQREMMRADRERRGGCAQRGCEEKGSNKFHGNVR